MKLLTKTSTDYFALTALILIVSGFLLYGFLHRQILDEMREQLQLEEQLVAQEIKAGRPVNFPLLKAEVVNKTRLNESPVFKDTLIYDQFRRHSEGYYMLRMPGMINNKVYMIEVMTTYIGWDHYSKAILYIFLFIAAMLVVFGSVINYFSNKKTLQPFLENLNRLKNFSVADNGKLVLQSSGIDEFKQLNMVLEALTDRVGNEYRALKEFTENASHEIQTPLSIIQSRLERMSQFITEENMAVYLSDAKAAVARLSKINRGLLLLAKLENQLFPDENLTDIRTVVLQQIDLLEDLVHHRQLLIQTDLEVLQVKVSTSLIDIMISNLFVNMVAYSPKGAKTGIQLGAKKLVFSNPGSPLDFDQSKLFVRFGKERIDYSGNGLGLPIVKQICKRYGWDILYRYTGGNHIFEIDFEPVQAVQTN